MPQNIADPVSDTHQRECFAGRGDRLTYRDHQILLRSFASTKVDVEDLQYFSLRMTMIEKISLRPMHAFGLGKAYGCT
jgi:hypothetical protein